MDVQLDELRLEINKLKPEIESLVKTLKIEKIEMQLLKLNLPMLTQI